MSTEENINFCRIKKHRSLGSLSLKDAISNAISEDQHGKIFEDNLNSFIPLTNLTDYNYDLLKELNLTFENV